MSEQLYKYVWGNLPCRLQWKGRTCRVLVWGKKNTVMVEFVDNGELLNTSRNALRKAKA